jgi:hydrogenase maturation protease
MLKQRILIAGIGNIFLGDDGFGVEVAGELVKRQFPPEVKIVDSGIRGRDLAFALLDGFEFVIFIDIVERGGKPGTLYIIEPDVEEISAQNQTPDPHKLDPLAVLKYAQSMGATVGRVIVIGCEPESCSEDSMNELSEPVKNAVLTAIEFVEKHVADFLSGPKS